MHACRDDVLSWYNLTRQYVIESPTSDDDYASTGQGNIIFLCSADHEQDWQPNPVDPYSAICNDHTYSIRRSRCCWSFSYYG